ncbi:MAG: VWA domain-containing protein [Lachnospiraceae bacterium]|nr:VWA domain-containing protein [Lachnospiraceae bacterium]
MFCRKCGKEIDDDVKFCPKCGTEVVACVKQEEIVREEQKEETADPVSQKDRKPLGKMWIGIGVAAMAAIIAGGAIFGVMKYHERQVSDMIAQASEMYEGGDLAGAEKIYGEILQLPYRAVKEEKDRIDVQVDKIHKLQDAKTKYDTLLSEWGKDAKYSLFNKEKEFDKDKKQIDKALADLDTENCTAYVDKLEKLMGELRDENKSRAKNVRQEMEEQINKFDKDSCEYFILSSYKESVSKYLSEKDYKSLFEAYDDFNNAVMSLPRASSAEYVVTGFSQVDVSQPGIVKLYINTEDRGLDADKFQVYESVSGTGDWKKCLLKELSQVQGDLTIDLVADVSTSMTDSFGTMQNAVVEFVNSTFPDTTLGLSLISSIYRRVLDFSKDASTVSSAVRGLYPEGRTSLYQSLYSSVMYTASAPGPRCVIAFTDGVNEPYDVGYDIQSDDVIDVSRTYQVPVYIIGIGSYVDGYALQHIADETGGEYYNINQVYDLGEIYKKIYYRQQKLWEAVYETSIDNSRNRKVYVLYYDEGQGVGMNFEEEVDAESLHYIYNASSGFSEANLLSFYTDRGYLSSDDLANVTKLEDIQTIINIYFAKNGYQFGKEDVLNKMISIGAISSNGYLDTNETLNRIKSDQVLFANYSAIYNRRFEIIYPVVAEIYQEYGGNIGLEQMKTEASARLGESDRTRFAPDITSSYKKVSR